MRFIALLMTVLSLLVAPLHAAENKTFPTPLPASYSGVLPCADCEGLEYRLNLLPDGIFYLRQTYLGRTDSAFSNIGVWTLKGSTLTLRAEHETIDMFQLEKDGQSLRMLDREGKAIQSDLNFSLARKSIFQPMKPELVLRGLVRYSADVASFEPCATGQKMVVIMDGDYLALKSAYVTARSKPGEPLLAEIDARVLKQARMEGEGAEPAVLVKRFITLTDKNTCPPAKADSTVSIENRTWVLTVLEGAPVPKKEGSQAAHLILDAKEKRVSGSGGCNRIAGGYTLDGSQLSFGQMVSTMMMCADGAEQERRFLKVLAEVATWEINGNMLTLRDKAGRNLAGFRVDH